MEVTRENFQEVLTELDTIIDKATFFGIDGEFTGIRSGSETNTFDPPAEHYSKLRTGSMDFLLVQFGLSVFTFNKDTQKYVQRSYNFYVFPTPLNRSAPDCRFMCQASSISFLASQGFDFNKLFNHGIPYLTSADEEKMMTQFEERQELGEEQPSLIAIPKNDRPQIEEICSRIDKFIESDAEELVIDRCNGFIRKLVHQEARLRWPGKFRFLNKSDCSGYRIVIQRSGTEEEEKQKTAERIENERSEIKKAVGLSALFRKISDSGKLIVGHNMLLDLCFVIRQFFGPLPKSYSEFKSLTHNLFPKLLDTKVLCKSKEFKDVVPLSNLSQLLEVVSKPPFTLPDVDSIEGKGYSNVVDKCHEAGYDAYITGLCFIALVNWLGEKQAEPTLVLPDSPLLNEYINKLFIARLRDIPYIDLVGNDVIPNRNHVFHLTFPKNWKQSDIVRLFSPFGGAIISRLTDTSAYVCLHRREQTNTVFKSLGKNQKSYKLQKYDTYQASLKTTDVPEERKRKLSSTKDESTEESESGSATNGVKKQEDDAWEVATGKRRRQGKKNETTLASSAPAANKPFAEDNTWD